MLGFKLVKTCGNGMQVFEVDEGEVAVIADGAIIVHGNHTYKAGSVSGFYARGFGGYFGSVPSDRTLCRSDKHEVWLSQRASVMSAGPHPDSKVKALKVEIGQQVWMESNLYQIEKAPNQNLKLVKVPA